MFRTIFQADTVEDMQEGVSVCFAMGELDAVVCQDSMDFIGYDSDEIAQELRCFHLAVLGQQFSVNELAGAIDGDEQVEFAFFCPYFGDIDMEITNGILGKLFSGKFLAFHLR